MEHYIGTITKILDPDLYTIEVDIPGRNTELKAFPKRSELDEPRVGDTVILHELDPIYKSYYIYEKIKENNFIGIRSRGKQVKLSKDELIIGIFDPEQDYNDIGEEDKTPKPTSWIKITKDGKVEVNSESNLELNVSGSIKIKVDGNTDINVSGNSNINSSGNTTIKAPTVKITGGNLVTRGKANTDTSGPFNCIPVCPFSGAPHTGSQVSGT